MFSIDKFGVPELKGFNNYIIWFIKAHAFLFKENLIGKNNDFEGLNVKED